LMGGPETGNDMLYTDDSAETGARQTETLYVEFRENNTPVDPLEWFMTNKDN